MLYYHLCSVKVASKKLIKKSKQKIFINILTSNSPVNIVEFNLLDNEEANELSKLIGFKGKYENKIKLVDIIRNRVKSTSMKIGFL